MIFSTLDRFPCAKGGDCSPRAACMALDKHNEVCECNEGYHGNGKLCEGEGSILTDCVFRVFSVRRSPCNGE